MKKNRKIELTTRVGKKITIYLPVEAVAENDQGTEVFMPSGECHIVTEPRKEVDELIYAVTIKKDDEDRDIYLTSIRQTAALSEILKEAGQVLNAASSGNYPKESILETVREVSRIAHDHTRTNVF